MKLRPEMKRTVVLTIGVLFISNFFQATLASLQMVKLAVSPLIITDVPVGDTFTINVTVADASKLFGYQFLLRYNTTVLTATSFKNLAYLTYAPFNIALPSGINDTAGWINVAYSCPPGERTGLTTLEPIPLAEITFIVDAYGTSALDIDEEATMLADIYGNAIKHPFNLVISDGFFSNVEEIELHDIAVISVTVNATTVKPGDVIAIDIIVKNNGDFFETFTVTAKYNLTATSFVDIGTTTVHNLEIGASTTLSFYWNTAGIAGGNYFVRAIAALAEDDNPVDNTRDSAIITVESHDVAVTSVSAYPRIVLQGQSVYVDVWVANEGTAIETFNVAVCYDATRIATTIVWNLLPRDSRWLGFVWNTTGVAEGAYIISAVADVVPSETDTGDNTYINGTVTICVPRISISPTSGPVGTKVTVKGYGFPAGVGAYLTFDDQLMGIIYTDSYGNLTASFNVPFSEAGPHTVKVPLYYYPYPPIAVEAPFTVIDVTPIDVNIDTGAIYFKGETAEFYVQTALKERTVDVTFLKATLYLPDGTTKTLTPQRIATGLYKITYAISGKGAMTGTYTLTVEASYITSTVNAQGNSIKTFTVKPTWEREAPKLAAYSMASLGLVSAMILLWRKEKKKLL